MIGACQIMSGTKIFVKLLCDVYCNIITLDPLELCRQDMDARLSSTRRNIQRISNMALVCVILLFSAIYGNSQGAAVPENMSSSRLPSSSSADAIRQSETAIPAIEPLSYADSDARIDHRDHSRDLKAEPEEVHHQQDFPTRHKRGALINWFKNLMHRRKGPSNRLSSGIITDDPFAGNSVDLSLDTYLKSGLPSAGLIVSSDALKQATFSSENNDGKASSTGYSPFKTPDLVQSFNQPTTDYRPHDLGEIHLQIPGAFIAPNNEPPLVQTHVQSAPEPATQSHQPVHGYDGHHGHHLAHEGSHHGQIEATVVQEEFPRPLFPAYAYAPQLEILPPQADPAFFANLLYDGPAEPTDAWTFPPAPVTPETDPTITTPSTLPPTETTQATMSLDSQSQVLLELANQLLSLQNNPSAYSSEMPTQSGQIKEETPRTDASLAVIDEASTESSSENADASVVEQTVQQASQTSPQSTPAAATMSEMSESSTSDEPHSSTEAPNGISLNGSGLTPEEIISLEQIAQIFGIQLGNFGPTPDPLSPEEAMIFNTMVDMAFAMLSDRLKAQNMDPLVVDFSVPVTKVMNSSFLGELLNDKVESDLLDDLMKHLPLPEDLLRHDEGLDMEESLNTTIDRNSAGSVDSAGEQELVPAEEDSTEQDPSSSSSSGGSSPGDYSSSSSSSGPSDDDTTTTTTTTVAPKNVNNKIKKKNKNKNKTKNGTNGKKNKHKKKKHNRSRLWSSKTRATGLSGFFRKKPPVSTVVQRVSATMNKQSVAMADPSNSSTEATSDATAASRPTSTEKPKRPGGDQGENFEPPTVLQSKASVQVTQDGEFQGLATLKRVSDVELDDEFNGVRHFKCYFAATNVTFLARLHVDERVDLVTSYESFRYSNSSHNSTVKLSRLPVLSGSIRFSYGKPDGHLTLESVKVYPPDTAIFLHQKMLDDYTEAYAVDMLAFLGQTLKGEVKTMFSEILEGTTSIFYGNHSSTEVQNSAETVSPNDAVTEASTMSTESAEQDQPSGGKEIEKTRKNNRRRKVPASTRRRHHKAMIGSSEAETAAAA